MDPGFLEQVRAAVQLSLQGDKQSVEQSTNLLTETLIKLPGFLPALLAISVNGRCDASVRKAAIIIFSKHCRLNWHKFVDHQPEFSEADRTIVKNEFLEALLRANDPEIVRLMGHCMHSILKKELSKNGWPDIEERIWQLLSTNPTQERVYIALVALHALAKARQYYIDEDREPVSKTTEHFFPTLLQLGQNLLQDLTPVNAALARMIVKVYYRTIRLDLDAYLRRIEVNDAWIDLHYNLVVASVKALTKMLEEKVPEAIYFETPYWEIMKWSFRTVKRYTFKYGEPDGEEEKYTEFATHWSQKYSLNFWNTIIDIVSHRKIIKVKTKTLIAAISCIFNLITNDHVIDKNENLDNLLFDTMFDLLKFNQEQKEEYEDNPIEYFRKNDEYVSSSSTTSQVLNIFGKAFKNKKFLKDFMKWVNVCLTTRVNPRNNQPITAEDTEAIFHIIETHSIYVTKIKDLSSILTPLLLHFVLPEMASPHGFLRMRACRMVTVYCATSFPVEMLKQISEGVTKCMVDPDLPVRCCAAQALEVLLNKPELQQHFLPNLQSILQIYVKLINEFENDTLIQSLQGIFELYKDHIAPYAIELVTNLATLFFKCVEKEAKAQDADDDGSENEREVMESGFACQGCINAIEEIFKANDSQEVLQKSYAMIEPIFAYCFSDDGLDFLDDVANLMNTFVYKLEPFPPGIWSYFVIISYSLIGKPKGKMPDFPAWVPESLRTLYNNLPEDAFAQEMIGNLAEILKNFAYKGSEMLYSGVDFYGNRLIDVYFEVIVQLLQHFIPHADTEFSSIAEVLTLAGYLLAQNHPNSVTFLPKVLEISVGALKTAPNQTIRDCFLYNLGYATWLNPKVTLDCLHQHGVLENVLQSWPDQHAKSVSYLPRKSSFIGMMSLFSLNVDELDKIKIPILEMYKAMVASLPKLYEDQQRVINLEFADSEDDDDEDLKNFGIDVDGYDDVDITEEDKPDDQAKRQQQKKDYKKLNDKIKEVHKQIHEIKEKENLYDVNDAREAFGGIASRLYGDKSDTINEILVFETTLRNLAQANPGLLTRIEAATTAEMKTTLEKTVADAKALIDSR